MATLTLDPSARGWYDKPAVWFKLKDYFTILNALCGLGAIALALEGHPYWSGFLICFSWVCDSLDGLVARLTKTFNEFGSEFDNMCDHLTHGIAPGFFVYAVYRDWFPIEEGLYGFVLLLLFSSILPIAASIRAARFAVKPIKVKGFWIGLPRPVSAFIIVGFCNGSMLELWPEVTYPLGIALVVLLGALNLGSIPFLSHHGRVWTRVVAPLLLAVLFVYASTMIAGPIALFFGYKVLEPEAFFDIVFFFLFGYLLLQWYGARPDEWKGAKEAVAAWHQQPNP